MENLANILLHFILYKSCAGDLNQQFCYLKALLSIMQAYFSCCNWLDKRLILSPIDPLRQLSYRIRPHTRPNPMSKQNEDTRVKIPTILHLMRLGYTYLSLKEGTWDTQTNIFPGIFIQT